MRAKPIVAIKTYAVSADELTLEAFFVTVLT
jgi:hypothetical protein